MVPSRRTAGSSNVRLLDGLLGLWLVVWLTLGVSTGAVLWQLSELGETVTTSGEAIVSSGEALQAVGSVPVVGERPAELGREISSAGADVATRGQDIQTQLRQLAVLLGAAIALLPTAPVMWLRLRRRLEVTPADHGEVSRRRLADR